MQNDSVDKIVTRYFATVAKVSFEFNGTTYRAKRLKVSPHLLRDYTCPPMCGGCCFKFTLDYIPGEDMPKGVKKRKVQFNGKEIEVWTDPQLANDGTRCCHLNSKDGRCGIYKERPFSCDFELIRTLQNEDPRRPNVLTQKLFGRGWSYARVDGGKGALCEMTPVTPKSVAEVHRKLGRLKMWADHFGLETHVDTLMEIVERGHLDHQIILSPDKRGQTGFGL